MILCKFVIQIYQVKWSKVTNNHEVSMEEKVEVFEERHFLIKVKNQESAQLIGQIRIK